VLHKSHPHTLLSAKSRSLLYHFSEEGKEKDDLLPRIAKGRSNSKDRQCQVRKSIIRRLHQMITLPLYIPKKYELMRKDSPWI
jgi:hypothetical protein